MSVATQVIQCYAQLEHTVARMLELARAREWVELPTLDHECVRIVERLRVLEPHALDQEQRSHAAALVERIRAQQDELVALVRPQLLDLTRRIVQLQREQKVRSTYRGTP